jgi:two-component system, LytTR family, sensor kinase
MNRVKAIRQVSFYLWVGAGWVLLWLLAYFVNYSATFFVRIPNELWRTVYLVAINLVFFEYTWPSITRKRTSVLSNIGIGLFFISILVVMLSYGLYGWRQLGIELNIYTDLSKDDQFAGTLIYHAMGGIMSVFFFGFIKHLQNYRGLIIATQQLRIEKQQAELNYLKSQTHPHFLFNTLNNIYSLARDKSDAAPESIVRLSTILRFMLFETRGEYITIEQEVNIINDYIALERLRYDNLLRITINHSIEDMNQTLPPLLLIPLVENAFKHGASETRGQSFIDIQLSVNKRKLEFVVRNSFQESSAEENVKDNIGLSNLRRQLELLYGDYNLSIQKAKSVFTATLNINLASHV